MNCKKHNKAIALYAGGDLPPRAVSKLKRHLADCAGCRDALTAMRALRTALDAANDSGADSLGLDAFRSDFSARLAEARASEPRPRFGWRRFAYATAASLLVAGGAGIGALRSSQAGALPPTAPTEIVTQRIVEPAPSKTKSAEPLTIRIATDNPNLVIYWLADSEPDIS